MSGDEKRYVQGIMLVCAAFVHHQKGENEIALNVSRRALRLLDYGAPHYYRIGVDSLKRYAEEIIFRRIRSLQNLAKDLEVHGVALLRDPELESCRGDAQN